MTESAEKVSRVVLYKHGMAFFERRAQVDGDTTLALSFRQDEMDDVLAYRRTASMRASSLRRRSSLSPRIRSKPSKHRTPG